MSDPAADRPTINALMHHQHDGPIRGKRERPRPSRTIQPGTVAPRRSRHAAATTTSVNAGATKMFSNLNGAPCIVPE